VAVLRDLHKLTGYSNDGLSRRTASRPRDEQEHDQCCAVEAQLAYSVRDSLGRAYNRTEFVEQRRKMQQAWADHLGKLRRGAPVVSIGRRKS
jgi:hypothetical protein